MKPKTVIFRYLIFRHLFYEMAPAFWVNLAIFSFIFLMAKILEIMNLVVNYGVGLWFVFQMLIQTIPTFLVFVIPMSTMMGILLGLLRLSNDNEVLALKASGVSIYQLLPPVVAFSLMGCLLTGFMCIYGSPWGRIALKTTLSQAVTSAIDIGIKPGQFNDDFKNIMIYAREVDREKKSMRHILIDDRQTSGLASTIVASDGTFHYDKNGAEFRLTLKDGVINNVDTGKKTVHSVQFGVYEFKLKMAKMLDFAGSTQKNRKEMSLSELVDTLNNTSKQDNEYYLTQMEFHRKFSLPISCFVLGLVALPLGAHSQRAKRSFGTLLGLGIFLFYYILMSAGWILGEARMLPPFVGVWGPNVIVAAIGVFLLFQSARERPLKLLTWLGRSFKAPKSIGTL